MSRRKRKGRDVSGILLLDKPTGLTSNRALQQVKHCYKAAKAGHTGTLDPLATGMLPVCLGKATKVTPYLLDADKIYITGARLGTRTDTGDAEGDVIDSAQVPDSLDEAAIEQVLQNFRGNLSQLPPMYSAIKVDGKRLYELARKGETVERQPRAIRIESLQLLDYRDGLAVLRVHCSKGTYVRTLVEDIGNALGTLAHVESLRRLSVGAFGEQAEMVNLDLLEDGREDLAALDKLLLPLDQALLHLPRVDLDPAFSHLFGEGQAVPQSRVVSENAAVIDESALIRIYADGRFLGLGRLAMGHLAPEKVFA